MLNLLSPFSANRTSKRERDQVSALCQTLTIPGAFIPPDSDKVIAKALLSREMGSLDLTNAALSLLRNNSRVDAILNLAWQKDEIALEKLLADGTLIALLNTPMMQALLFSCPIPDLRVERLLTQIRLLLLDRALKAGWYPDKAIAKVAAALAAQAFLTEYIFEESDNETDLISMLCTRIESQSADFIDSFSLAVLASYRRLVDLDFVDKIASLVNGSTDPVIHILWRYQVIEPARQRDLLKEIRGLTDINDETSLIVRSLYEKNPYPNWVCYHRNEPLTAHQVLTMACSGVDLDAFGDTNSPRILIAGCGTGLTAIDDAVLWKDSQILALDLSLNSIAYAMRSAEEIEVSSIEFAHGDILHLGSLDRAFDYISCTGVLHHMTDPIMGWRALVDKCKPGGVMRIGLYSAASRQAIIAAQALLKNVTEGSNAREISKARRYLIDHAYRSGMADEIYADIFGIADFFNVSMCRDLLFHVQEHNYTIPELADAIDQLGLRFCGFIDSHGSLLKAYREFAPNDPAGLNLSSWAQFESLSPELFPKMYDFLVQKIVG
ncbi:MAG: class I SAM-dependent methyltransferase [Rhodospirillaceae bacterium]